MRLIGKKVIRKEGLAKVTGQALYISDITMPKMLHGITIRSEIPRGRIRKIRFDPRINWNEFTVVTAEDIPGKNIVTLIVEDQPFLADKIVNHREEAILLLAHPNRNALQEARKYVNIDYDPLPAIFSIEESESRKTIIWGTDNKLRSFRIQKGDIRQAWSKADFMVEGTYRTGAQEQLYIEPQGVIAIADPDHGVSIWGSMQCPYYVQKALKPLFNLPGEKVRVIQTETGGGFGGKEDYPSILAGHAALLSWKSKRPVKMIYDRAEDMVATTKRHPSRTKIKSAVTKTGKILGHQIEFALDGGAYATLSSVVLSRGTIHAVGPYEIPHVDVSAIAYATNLPPHGAFRGFGAPQSIFAMERHMDKIAKACGLPDDEVRRRNFVNKGKCLSTGQCVREKINWKTILDLALRKSDYKNKKTKFSRTNKSSRIKYGMGLAAFMHGAGFTGSGEKMLASIVALEATRRGRIRVLTANTEIGQGTNTIFSQIVADELGLDYQDIEIAQPDTENVPNSGPTVASRTCMVVGGLLRQSAAKLRDILIQSDYLKSPYQRTDFLLACKNYLRQMGPLKASCQYEQPEWISWDDQTYQGDAYATYAWAAYVAEVSIDTLTYQTKVENIWAVQEAGQIVHPILAAGQIEGGIAQAIGYALYEKVIWNNGRMLNNQMTNYIMPTAADIGRIHVHFSKPDPKEGFLAPKGIGELPMDGPAPAILNAIENALGVSVDEIPLLPEDLERLSRRNHA